MKTVAILGGGLSGLACARLIADLRADLRVMLLESAPRAGGTILTRDEGGFRCEAGPNGFLNRHPSTLALAVRAGLADEILTGCEQVRRRFVLHGGRLRRFPDSVGTFLTTDLLSWPARARMLLEPFVPRRRGGGDETVGQFARRRLGREASESLVDPVVSGIYAGDPERLSLRSTLPQAAHLEARGGSLLAAYVRSRERNEEGHGVSPAAVGRRRLVSFAGGAARLVEALATGLGESVRLRCRARTVVRDGRRFRVEVEGPGQPEIVADALISALPAPEAARVLGAMDPDLARACLAIPHAPVAMVALGYREADVPHPLDGFGHLTTPADGGSVLGVLWATSIFPGRRAPAGHVLLQAILGGARDPRAVESSEDELADAATASLETALGITSAPVLARVFRHVPGLPQYEVGHADRVRAVEDACRRNPGLFVTGNAFRGIGMNACTADAELVAGAVASYLAGAAGSAGAATPFAEDAAPRPVPA